MNINIAYSFFALVVISACDNAGSASPIVGKANNAGTDAMKMHIDYYAYACPENPDTIRIAFDASNTYGGGASTMWEIANLDYSVVEAELEAVDRQNGVMFAGWIMFADNVLIRERSLNVGHGWREWGDWRPIKNGIVEEKRGHYIEQRNGHWEYMKRGYQWFDDERVFKMIINPDPRLDWVWDVCPS